MTKKDWLDFGLQLAGLVAGLSVVVWQVGGPTSPAVRCLLRRPRRVRIMGRALMRPIVGTLWASS